MNSVMTGLIYLLFFLSGAAALIYQVIWVRSLALVFGGSHLAVTTVLAIFMAGLALGGRIIGKYVDNVQKPLRLYGLLELGIAFFALVFMGLMKIYPSIYIPLAAGRDDSHLYLTVIRVLFAVCVLIMPTTLMGGTLPVLSRCISRVPADLRIHLSFLYGLNTLGAVLGAFAAGFFFLRLYSVSTTLYIAVALNTVVGLAGIMLQKRLKASEPQASISGEIALDEAQAQSGLHESHNTSYLPHKLVLWGIAVSGCCALGYEVLWTRILTIAVGASVYGFTTMLVAFLAGISLGGGAYGISARLLRTAKRGAERSIAWFGIVQMLIGATALLVTLYLRDLPANVVRLQHYFSGAAEGYFTARQWSSFVLAFTYMLIPAFLMGLAFPMAGKIHAERRRAVGGAVGEVLAYNTVGAIIGSALSGYVLTYFLGIERSLQVLILINLGFGFLILFSTRHSRALNWSIASLTVLSLFLLTINRDALRIWDMQYFAVFRSNQLESFSTPEKVKDTLANTDVLYYGEGVESIVSSIKVKGGEQSFVTNGRVEASSHLQAQQCQFVLGHLPMLLNKNPKSVLVVGLGSGMTLGATSLHPSVQNLTLVELEPEVLGVARTFREYNHYVLENPKLKIVFNDGRNFLLTTRNKYDVITADPIHPWFRGAGYLYTSEYFKLASEHLTPGGIICQWLPLYEMTPVDLKSVVRTVGQHFKYMALWMTHYDSEIVASNSPLVFDELDIDKRIRVPVIHEDLSRVMMGSGTEFLSYFLMGDAGMRRFSRGGTINTDNNLYLEFAAPLSMGTPSVMAENVEALLAYREEILPYMPASKDGLDIAETRSKWASHADARGRTGTALALYLRGEARTSAFENIMADLDRRYPSFAPARFLKNEYISRLNLEPRLLDQVQMDVLSEYGFPTSLTISAVLIPVTPERASVAFVDNDARKIYGEVYIDGHDKEDYIRRLAARALEEIRALYEQESKAAVSSGLAKPREKIISEKIRIAIDRRIRAPQ